MFVQNLTKLKYRPIAVRELSWQQRKLGIKLSGHAGNNRLPDTLVSRHYTADGTVTNLAVLNRDTNSLTKRDGGLDRIRQTQACKS